MAPLSPHEQGTHSSSTRVLDFEGIPKQMRDGLYARMQMEHRDGDEVMMFTSEACGRVLNTRGPVVRELIMRRLSWREFILALGLHTGEEMESPSFARRFAAGRKSEALISGGQFVARLAEHFGLLTEERLQGLTVIPPALPIIDMFELIRQEICAEFRDTWAWVPAGPARQEGDVGGVAEEAPVAPGGGDEDEEMPQAVPPPPRTQGERITRLEEEVYSMREAFQVQREVLDRMTSDFSRFTTQTVTSLARLMDRAGVPYTRYTESPVEFQRCTRQGTNGAITSTASQQPDP
ncbi:hypothetical protein Tco_1147490, partial [Tanacetum coccineum]